MKSFVVCVYWYNEKMPITLDGIFDFQLICHPILICLPSQMSELIAFLWTTILQVTPETPSLVLFIWGIAVVSTDTEWQYSTEGIYMIGLYLSKHKHMLD